MNKELRNIKNQLQEIAEKESIRLGRMSRRLQKHGGSLETIQAIRNEALELHNTAYPERLLDDFKVWKFAFK